MRIGMEVRDRLRARPRRLRRSRASLAAIVMPGPRSVRAARGHLRGRPVGDRPPGRPLRVPAHARRHRGRGRRRRPHPRRHRRPGHVPRRRRGQRAGLRRRRTSTRSRTPCGSRTTWRQGQVEGMSLPFYGPAMAVATGQARHVGDLPHGQGGQRRPRRRRPPGLRVDQARRRGPARVAAPGRHAVAGRAGRAVRHPVPARVRRHPRAARRGSRSPSGPTPALQPRRRLPRPARPSTTTSPPG